jgi:molecular chaperone HtpG
LYAKKVMIVEHCEDLLPRYLRFIKGVVDSADLPLNISRQMLQQDRHIAQIRKWLTKKVLDELSEMHEKEPDKYLVFWNEFGRAMKEGVSSDFDNKDKLIALLRFQSSRDAEQLTALKDYVERMPEGQDHIYYLTGETRDVVDNSPVLEAYKEKGYEVLYLVEPVDELLVQYLTEYEGKRLKSAGKGRSKLDGGGEESLKEQEKESSGLLELIQKKLDKYVKQVRLTNRLTRSPGCLVVEEHDYSPQLERLLQQQKQRRVLELNPNHPLFSKMRGIYEANNDDPRLGSCAELLLGYAALAEGSPLPEPVEFNRLLAELITQSL